MKILLYHWKAYSDRFLEHNLQAMGHEVNVWSNDAVMQDKESALFFLENELEKGYDVVFSYNYFKMIAIACHTKGIPYIAWTQDSPMLGMYDHTALFETNYFFCFDYEQCERMKQSGSKHVFYCPLATDVFSMQKTVDSCTEKEKNTYRAGISFVGSLYTERDMWSDLSGMPEFLKGYFDGIVETQLRLPMLRFSQAGIPFDVMKKIQQVLDFKGLEDSSVRYEELIDNLIDRQVTVMERRKMIQLLEGRTNFKLYTSSDTSIYPKVNNCGRVDYYTEMPKVFKHSDINLNVTLRSIRSGIPLRVLDVIAAGGFLLTNVQPELELFFKEGESIATFQSLEEMDEKIDFYLANDAARKRIIENGYRIVENQFDFKVRLPQIFEMAGLS